MDMGIFGVFINAVMSGGKKDGGASRLSSSGNPPPPLPQRQKFYCKYCGIAFPDVRTLIINTCQRNPEGSRKHVLYEGSEKPQYTCKFCGQTYRTIGDMSVNTCQKKPGTRRHEPVL
jgi:hypothetical protein